MHKIATKLIAFHLFVCMCFATSCSNAPILTICDEEVFESETVTDDSHAIPLEQAMNTLFSYLIDNGVCTKGQIDDFIDDTFQVRGKTGITRSGATIESSILHVINFANQNGYAILSADDRIPDDIIAILDEGNTCIENFICNDEDMLMPTDDDDTSAELYYEWISQGGIAKAAVKQEIDKKCLRYAENKICNDEEAFIINNEMYEDYSWITTDKVEHCKMVTKWHQDAPFNKYCPYVGLKKEEQAPAGCIPVAIAQILAYHNYPSYTFNGVAISYSALKKEYYNYNNTDKDMAGLLLYAIGDLCNVHYGKMGDKPFGLAFPWNAVECLEKLEYQNVKLSYGYHTEEIMNSINRKCPVIISAISGAVQGHAWVIDAYIRMRYENIYTGDIARNGLLFHCNWGWGGKCNGYFTAGVFDPSSAFMFDDTSISNVLSSPRNYTNTINYITYSKL